MLCSISCVSEMMGSSMTIKVVFPRKAFRTQITHVSLSLLCMNQHVSLHVSFLREGFETNGTLISTSTNQIIWRGIRIGLTTAMITVSRYWRMMMKRVMKTVQRKAIDWTKPWSWRRSTERRTQFPCKHRQYSSVTLLATKYALKNYACHANCFATVQYAFVK